MQVRTLGLFAFIACLGLSLPALAQEQFGLVVQVESPDFPDLNTNGIISGTLGETFDFTGNLVISTSGIVGEEGPQGWSWGVHNEGITIQATTTAGTVSADVANGGLVNFGFVVSDLIDPAKNAGKQGSTQAVVLSFTQPITLPPNTDQISCKNTYRATIGAADVAAFVRFENGLVGKGQPVQCNITYKGQTAVPTLGQKLLTVKAPTVDEICDNGIDDDGDSKIDCLDDDCPACPPEDCDDTVDNDKDGKIDCADEDCANAPNCPKPEVCDDTVDNDLDGDTDCDDTDCANAANCLTGNGLSLELDAPGSTSAGGKNVVEVGDTAFEVTAYVVPVGDPLEEGAQGWSISISHDVADLDIQNGGGFPTIDGTDAAANFLGGFQKTEVVDPAKNAGKGGFVSAVVLSFTEAKFLDATKAQSIAKAKYTVKAGAPEGNFPTLIEYLDGLRGQGQPVPNVITVKGDTLNPLSRTNLEVKKGTIVPPDKNNFVRGDANDDGKVNIADPIWIINELVRQGPATKCKSTADANDDGLVDLSDSMYLIQWRFLGGPTPPAPFPACGADPTKDDLSCEKGIITQCPTP